ncbi:MAG: phosphatidylserine decarboxylase [Gammaproteobacteria bacterium]|nr:MAG: phosphatidylserine decarboxylase [Gammaproteobacteria bacterium]
MKQHITSIVSKYFGLFASKAFYPWFQHIVNQSYVSLMGLDMSEFYAPSSYHTLNKLFTRRFREPRNFSSNKSDFISPCDAYISECGDLDGDIALQIKEMSYSISELLGEHFSKADKARLTSGQFMNFYLSPKDYHRYHIPIDLKIIKAVHIPGKLYPVNNSSLNKRLNLFVENERIVLACETEEKKHFYMVLIGALNVGKMQIGFDHKIQTNASIKHAQSYEYENLYLQKGEDFGCFEMGSTVVIISEPGLLELKITPGQTVRFGQNVSKLI